MIRKYEKFSIRDGRIEINVLRWEQKKIHIPVWRCWNLCLESLREAEMAKLDHACAFQILSEGLRFTCDKNTFQNTSVMLRTFIQGKKEFCP